MTYLPVHRSIRSSQFFSAKNFAYTRKTMLIRTGVNWLPTQMSNALLCLVARAAGAAAAAAAAASADSPIRVIK